MDTSSIFYHRHYYRSLDKHAAKTIKHEANILLQDAQKAIEHIQYAVHRAEKKLDEAKIYGEPVTEHKETWRIKTIREYANTAIEYLHYIESDVQDIRKFIKKSAPAFRRTKEHRVEATYSAKSKLEEAQYLLERIEKFTDLAWQLLHRNLNTGEYFIYCDTCGMSIQTSDVHQT